ncbi:hypothetical protein PHYSODRAFT_527750 [Phytophthora sojae]|uniref:Uncharacterized protein n=1 Tax=Phytophthora sojae (strain P6497) TaxID=1094619 RepID=G5A8Z5_PHYSP|nr:hypothetical protein PHYSODRAFT_527750 [Phytophthora sojae]EGZ08371.1 hypothetical protein PHYSODRAFT_527750 [Phytophthora sojae]|eukprot:XP_009536543.1 hypothetical protein PHYSODRAFT_527750 [Phytophthora sojae]
MLRRQPSSSQSPTTHSTSRTPSFIAMYSASVLDWALMPCLREPYEIALPSR